MALTLNKLPAKYSAVKYLCVEIINNKHSIRCNSSQFWSHVKMGPPDVILGIAEAYRRDTDKRKVNLGVGAYRDDNGKPYVLPSVRKAEEILYKKRMNHEYAPIGGVGTYTAAAAKLAFGDCNPILQNKSNCTVQTISGTGALRIGLEFLSKFHAKTKTVWISAPTWGNHPQICKTLGLGVKRYRYFDPKTNGFDCRGAFEDMCKIPEGSILLLHACAHNPTGVDPKPEQWAQIADICKEKNLYPFFDMAYQGFATGNVDNDAAALRLFMKKGLQVTLAQSFAKNMGMYGERIGALHIDCGDPDTANKVMSQVKIIIRTGYSSPPLYGARLVQEILTSEKLTQIWLGDVKNMADRIIAMRKALREALEGLGSNIKWNHITDQIGMFCYTGLKPDQVARLTKEYHIYLTKDGRISIAGINTKNVKYIADAIHKVTS